MKLLKTEKQTPDNTLTIDKLRGTKTQIEIDGFEAIILHFFAYSIIGGKGSARKVFSDSPDSMYNILGDFLEKEFGKDSDALSKWVEENISVVLDCSNSAKGRGITIKMFN